MVGTPKKRYRRHMLAVMAGQYAVDDRGLMRALREQQLTGVMEDPWTGERYCPSCERPEDFCNCGCESEDDYL